MATSIIDGPWHVYGPMAAEAAPPQTYPIIDPDNDAGPSLFYQGTCIPDPRFVYQKDRVQGSASTVPSFFAPARMKSIGQIPAALGAANIAAAQHPVLNTAMTLVTSATLGVALNVPIRSFSGAYNGTAPSTAAIALDFGFAFGNCTSAITTIVVSDSTLFAVGMPLVICGVGNSGGTVPLMTTVTSLTDATHIVVANAPLASNSAAPIGTGDLWGGMTASGQAQPPLAASPYLAGGPDALLDPRQTISRVVRIVGLSGSTGGIFTVAGWDIYGEPMTEAITVAGGAQTIYGAKCFKYIASVTPNFADSSHNYTVGTGDVFGFAFRTLVWEDTVAFWAGAPQVTATGWLAGVTTTPSSTTGDVRGTLQTGAAGAGSGIGSNASNGTVSSLAMTGRRLEISQFVNVAAMLSATPSNANSLLGATQA